ncbi:hypothetical protein PM082_018542 [Marasmius tenuissimus]|nr:hypothetical protein PM082_018542 [Marasmius tenuissimus]
MSAEQFQAISRVVINAVSEHRWIWSFDYSAASLVIYDILLNLDLEICLIWWSPWTAVKALHLFQRYLALVDVVGLHFYPLLIGLRKVHTLTDPGPCMLATKAIFWIGFIGVLLAEALMSLRIWAVWRQNKCITVVLGALYIGCFTPLAIYYGKFVNGIICKSCPSPSFLSFSLPNVVANPPFSIPNREGCFVAGGNNLLYMTWTMLAVFILMMIPVAQLYHGGGKAGVTKIMYQDGITYFVFQLCKYFYTEPT